MSEDLSLGALLRETRERRGETLEQAQRQTAISPTLLSELESGEFRVEPVYARLAAANYAAYLGLDSGEVTALFDREFGRPDIPAPSLARGYGTSPFPILWDRFPLSSRLSNFSRTVPAIWVIAAAAAIALAVPLVIHFWGDLEEASPPAADASETTPALPLAGDGNPPAEADPGGAGFAPIAALETPPAPFAETSITADNGDAAVGETDIAEEEGAVTLPVPGEPVPGTELQEEPEVPDIAPSLILRAEAVDSTWVRIEWDGGAGAAEEIIPMGESRQWEAADSFLVFSGRPHGVRFHLQGQLLGDGRLGDPSRVLRFRASADGVVLLGADLTPLSAVPLPDPDAAASPGEPPTR